MATAEDTKQQFIEAVRQGTHVLVTVRNDPTVDQLSACIALTVLLNSLGKRATAVFSGKVPQNIDFLKPGKMLQSNTDSLQDFIIALDKNKADKLRYKVEDTMVKVYITPYQTSLSEKDVVYSKGDFNVDLVIALGAHAQAELDKAITAHGRILHDATVITMDTRAGASSDLGSVNWIDTEVSSLSEMLAWALDELIVDKMDALDVQVATALLAGIVSETESFGNSKTTPATMEVAARLLAAGANQQLVATRLSGPLKVPMPASAAGTDNASDDSSADANAGRKPKPSNRPEQPQDQSQSQSQDQGQSQMSNADDAGASVETGSADDVTHLLSGDDSAPIATAKPPEVSQTAQSPSDNGSKQQKSFKNNNNRKQGNDRPQAAPVVPAPNPDPATAAAAAFAAPAGAPATAPLANDYPEPEPEPDTHSVAPTSDNLGTAPLTPSTAPVPTPEVSETAQAIDQLGLVSPVASAPAAPAAPAEETVAFTAPPAGFDAPAPTDSGPVPMTPPPIPPMPRG